MHQALSRRAFMGAAGGVAVGLAAGPSPSAWAQPGAAPAAAGAAAPTGPGKVVKIIGIAASPRQGKSTTMAVQAALDAAKQPGVEVELIELAGLKIPGELAAGLPLEPGQRDDFPAVAAKLKEPAVAGIILGTPTYMGGMSSLCKAFLDRCIVLRRTWDLRDKVFGAIAVGGSRNGGQDTTLLTLIAAMMRQDVIVVGDGKPTAHPGAALQSDKDSVAGDEAGLASARSLGKRVAEVALRLAR